MRVATSAKPHAVSRDARIRPSRLSGEPPADWIIRVNRNSRNRNCRRRNCRRPAPPDSGATHAPPRPSVSGIDRRRMARPARLRSFPPSRTRYGWQAGATARHKHLRAIAPKRREEGDSCWTAAKADGAPCMVCTLSRRWVCASSGRVARAGRLASGLFRRDQHDVPRGVTARYCKPAVP